MPKRKGLTLLLDEDVSSAVLAEVLEWKGYNVEFVRKETKDHLIRARLTRSRMPVFLMKD